MTTNQSPTLASWQKLYEQALKFKEVAPWQWMWDSDIFGVQNPLNQEIGYCCVMGRAGEHYGLAVYLGSEGLEGYLKIMAGEIEAGDPDSLFIQQCLMVSFEERRFLKEADLKIIRQLGLKFRGKNTWPLLRSYEPGLFPWYFTSSQAEYLTLALEQTLNVVLRFKNNPKLLDTQDNHYLVRIKEGQEWEDEYLEPAELEDKVIQTELVSQQQIETLQQKAAKSELIFEIDFFHFPAPINDQPRPYFPYGFLIVDHHSYFVFKSGIMKREELFLEFPPQLLELLEDLKLLPQEIWVKKEEVFLLLKDLTNRLQIKLKLVKRLNALEEARQYMNQFFRQGGVI